MKRLKLLTVAALVLLMIGHTVIAQPNRDGAPVVQKRRSIAFVIGELTQEARLSWKREQRWPRQRESYAQQKGFGVDNASLVRVLSRRLQRDSALDAYIKWQVMSFAPDFSELKEQDYRRILAVVPKLASQPKPAPPPKPRGGGVGIGLGVQTSFVTDFTPVPGSSGGRPHLGVVGPGSGTNMGLRGALSPNDRYGPKPEDIARARLNEVERFAQAKSDIEANNFVVLAYRDALARELPDKDGVRLLFMLQDVTDRVKAGDPSFIPALERLVLATDAVAAGTPVPNNVRARLAHGVVQLAKLKTIVVTDVHSTTGGDVVAQKQYVNISRGVAQRMLENLSVGADP